MSSSSHTAQSAFCFPGEQARPKTLGRADQKCRADIRREQEAPKLRRLLAAMNRAEWTQADLARAWGIDEKCVRSILCGDAPIGERLEHPAVNALFMCWCEIAIEERKATAIVIPLPVATARAGTATGQFAAIACEALADGKIDPQEEKALGAAAVRVVSTISALRSPR